MSDPLTSNENQILHVVIPADVLGKLLKSIPRPDIPQSMDFTVQWLEVHGANGELVRCGALPADPFRSLLNRALVKQRAHLTAAQRVAKVEALIGAYPTIPLAP